MIVGLPSSPVNVEQVQRPDIGVGAEQGEETSERALGTFFDDGLFDNVTLEERVELGKSSEQVDGSFVFTE